jgi:hypothetical protein
MLIGGGTQQAGAQRPSPPASAKCDLPGGKSVAVDYSRPQMKERKIFGGLVPYGQVWRAGANEATTFVTTADLMIGGKHVPQAVTPSSRFQTKTSGRSLSARKPVNGAFLTPRVST